MWTPDHFAAPEAGWDAELITENPFGIMISSDAGVPLATHVPMLIHPEDRARARSGLAGCRIVGHQARENHQWQSLADGDRLLLIFNGPHGYVSPTLYPDQPAAPTWNYTAVHLTGPVTLFHDHDELLRVVNLTVDTTERDRDPGWDRDPSRGYFDRIVGGIVAFQVTVESVASTYKLSQDQPAHRRALVTEQALADPDHGRRRLGDWMRRAGGGAPG